VHRAVPLTAALCLAAAARIPGTVVHASTAPSGSVVRIGHPLGQVEVRSDVEVTAAEGAVVNSVGVVRTARRLMRGVAYAYNEEPATRAGRAPRPAARVTADEGATRPGTTP
jgi:2-methylaconitate cis-trans-isomerase PrpF